jgi:cobalt-zinc-cadmium efflux system outer membrane protein
MRLLFVPLGLAALCALPVQAAAQAITSPDTLAPTLSTVDGNSQRRTDAGPLTLAAAIRLAFERNAGLRAATREIDIAGGQRIQAGARPNPEIAVTSEGLRNGQRTRSVQLSQPLDLGGKRAARIAAADIGVDLASAELAAARTALRADVVTAFFDVVAAQERVQLAHASQQLAQRASAATARRVIAGKISPVDETRARVAEASSKIEVNQARNELALAMRRLAALWGSNLPDFSSVIAPEAAIGGAPGMPDALAYLPGAPELARARLEVSRREALANVERRLRVPDITVIVGRQRQEQFGQASPRQTIVGLSVPLPLFDRNQGNVLSALRRADKAKDEFAATESRLATELAAAAARLDSARNELQILRDEILPGARSAYDASSTGFELGKFGFLEVLDAQRTLVQGKTQYVRALAESHRAAAEIDRIVGHVDPDGTLDVPAIHPQESK